MAEPDHIFINPLPNLAHGGYPAGFPFFYIKPSQNEKIIRKFYPEENGPVTNVDPIGNSPVIIRKVVSFGKLYFVWPYLVFVMALIMFETFKSVDVPIYFEFLNCNGVSSFP